MTTIGTLQSSLHSDYYSFPLLFRKAILKLKKKKKKFKQRKVIFGIPAETLLQSCFLSHKTSYRTNPESFIEPESVKTKPRHEFKTVRQSFDIFLLNVWWSSAKTRSTVTLPICQPLLPSLRPPTPVSATEYILLWRLIDSRNSIDFIVKAD